MRKISAHHPALDHKPEEILSKISQIGVAGDISSVPGDAKMWLFLQKCLNDCIEGHKKCQTMQHLTWYPQRLLYLTQDESHKNILQLIQTQNHPPSSRYIALSHCWGLPVPFCTTKQNISVLLDNIALSTLPRTFQDCVTTARRLGVHYIWIDNLCIIQDDHEDWAHHAQCMDKIYENALFTVAAVSSSNGRVPFLGLEAPSDRDNWQAINIDIDTKSVKSGSANKNSVSPQLKARRYGLCLTPNFFAGPLEYRGWAWQERYLSTRIINFTEDEARWYCKTSQVCECRSLMQSADLISSQDLELTQDEGSKQILPRKWRDIVTEYSKRQLTYSTDRLPALSGVASRFYPYLESEYLAGIWLADFPRGLAWYRRELSDSPSNKIEMQCSSNNGIPSWSWASIYPQVYWMWGFCLRGSPLFPVGYEYILLESQVELISYNCRPSSHNTFGEVEMGSYIQLRGRVVEAEICSDIYGCASVRRKGFGPQHVVPDCPIVSPSSKSLTKPLHSESHSEDAKKSKTIRRAVETDRLDKNLTKDKRFNGQVYCLLLFTTTQNEKHNVCVLILGKEANSNDRYQRLGIGNSNAGWGRPLYKQRKTWEIWEGWEELEEWEEWEKWFADAKVYELTIL